MRTLPAGPDLIDAVCEFLLSGERSSPFLAQVAANSLGIVRREWANRTAADALTVARLEPLLGRTGEAAALEFALAEAISEERLSFDMAEVREHLWASVMAELAIDQPRYAGYLQAIDEGRGA